MNLYDRINELAKERGLSVCGLCKKAKVATSSIYELKSDKKVDINRKTAEKLATALDISVDELYGKEKSPVAVAPTTRDSERKQKYEVIYDIFYGLSEESMKLAITGLQYLVSIPEDQLPEAVRYLKYLAESKGNQ